MSGNLSVCREKNNHFFLISACPDIKPESDPDFILSSYNASAGTQVLIGCKKFGYRLEGPHNVTCFSNQTWSDNLSKLECKCMSRSWFMLILSRSIKQLFKLTIKNCKQNQRNYRIC